ncbi:MAG: hypothetical protein KF897_04180 [Opitutaceae bacterium]|nr:hypothetical protein [Opitutaceae bacterium]
MPTRPRQPSASARQPAGRRLTGRPAGRSGPATPRPRDPVAAAAGAARSRRLARAGEYASPACAMPEIED